MNLLKKSTILLAVFLYLIIGMGWVVYFNINSAYPYHLSWLGFVIDVFMAVVWPFYPFFLLLSGERNLIIQGAIGLTIAIIVFGTLAFFVRRKNQKARAG